MTRWRGTLRFLAWLLASLFGLLSLLVVFHVATHGRTPAIRSDSRDPTSASIASLAWMDIGGRPQAVLIRGEDVRKPMLLVLHGGPGMSQMYLAHAFQRSLERSFVVVQWDRRGAGKSFHPEIAPESLTLERLLGDTVELTRKLRDRFRPPRLVLVGHSWGTYLGVEAVTRHPELFDLYVGIGQLAYFGAKNREVQSRFVREEATRRGDEDALQAVNQGDRSLEPFLFRYGAEVRGETSFWPLFFRGLAAPEYTLFDISRLMKGLALYDRSPLATINTNPIETMTRFDIPVVFFTGRYDQTDPADLTQMYFDAIVAPSKRMVWFERSAHFPFLEEPERFAEEMRIAVEELSEL